MNKVRDKLIIFDTTLRDGEQSPGAGMSASDKLRIAKKLEFLGVDVIEAGFAAASQGDFEAVCAIAKSIRNSTVCSLARAKVEDVRKAGEAIAAAPRRRIHTFIATSTLHMEKKLQMTPEQVIARAVEAIRVAKEYTDDIEFSCEDASRSEPEFLYRIIEAAIREGATTINIPDTVGYALPSQFGHFIKDLREHVYNADQAVWSVHCHNDLGLALANSLSGVIHGGARQVECSINGLGERAGNCALEELVMAVKTRNDYFNLGVDINTQQLVPASKLVSSITGFPIQPNKAIVGANAFAHASGIHQDGVLKSKETYEIMTPESVGWKSNRMVLGKLSGRSAFRQRVRELAIPTKSETEIDEAFARFKDLADRKSEIFDEDIQSLFDTRNVVQQAIHFVSLKQSSETGQRPQAEVVYMDHGEERVGRADGNGPVDATFRAIESCAKSGAELLLFSINALTSGAESQGEVTVRLTLGGRVVNGNGSDPDILAASAKAYLDALNKLTNQAERTNPQFGQEPTP
ncbi:2-isopropylmalate synthase [Parasutterella muris]|uniref:2-isopropylmalate synthase n=2 Tax=Parasutterella TaxID=577310 RepID=UPI00203FA186|nr:2-isopropylmalate synthase [Parasutterella muris]